MLSNLEMQACQMLCDESYRKPLRPFRLPSSWWRVTKAYACLLARDEVSLEVFGHDGCQDTNKAQKQHFKPWKRAHGLMEASRRGILFIKHFEGVKSYGECLTTHLPRIHYAKAGICCWQRKVSRILWIFSQLEMAPKHLLSLCCLSHYSKWPGKTFFPLASLG